MLFIFNLGCAVLFLATKVSTKSSVVPFVVLPPFLRLNDTNTITITPIRVKSENVDIQVLINGIKGDKNIVVYTQKLKAKRAGSPHSLSFELDSTIDKAEIKIDIEGHAKFESELLSKPNLEMLHIHTDKAIYSAGEVVSVRALPLTYSGTLYDGIIEFALVNPDGFELIRKYNSTNDGYMPLQFHLPEHLFYGEWRITARPKYFRDSDLSFETTFFVRSYVLPSFKISVYLGEGQHVDSTDVTVNARYFHGAPISGTLSLSCTSHKRASESGKSQLILQSQVSLVI